MYALFIIIASLLVATWYLQNTAGTMFKAFVLGAVSFCVLAVLDFSVLFSGIIGVVVYAITHFILHKKAIKNEIIINLEFK